MQVDTGRPAAQDGQVSPISKVLRETLVELGISQTALALRIGAGQARVNKWVTTVEPKLNRLPELEDALNLPRGYLLRRAGYVADSDTWTTEQAIVADRELARHEREALLAAYRSFRRDRERRLAETADG